MKLEDNNYIYDGIYFDLNAKIPWYNACYVKGYHLKSGGNVYRQEHIIAETKYAMLLENPITHEQKWFKKTQLALINSLEKYAPFIKSCEDLKLKKGNFSLEIGGGCKYNWVRVCELYYKSCEGEWDDMIYDFAYEEY